MSVPAIRCGASCYVCAHVACSMCASGFEEAESELGVPVCEAVSSECTVGKGIRAIVLIAVTALVVLFTLVRFSRFNTYS